MYINLSILLSVIKIRALTITILKVQNTVNSETPVQVGKY